MKKLLTLITGIALWAMPFTASAEATFNIVDNFPFGGNVLGEVQFCIATTFPMLGDGGYGFSSKHRPMTFVFMQAGQNSIQEDLSIRVFDPDAYGTKNTHETYPSSAAGDYVSFIGDEHWIVPSWPGSWTVEVVEVNEDGIIYRDKGRFSTWVQSRIETTPVSQVVGRREGGSSESLDDVEVTSVDYIVFN